MSVAFAEIEHPAVDEFKLALWMDELGIESGPIFGAHRLTGGTQNILMRFRRGGREFVLRRGPPSLRPESNRTIMREARLLRALAGTGVPHPRFIAGADDPEILGATFYIMDVVEGYNATVGMSPQMQADPALRHRMGLSLVETLAQVCKLDIVALGLEDFGKLDGFLTRQADRWASHLNGYERHVGWTGRSELVGVTEIGQWLSDNVPHTYHTGLIHGDYHIGNVIYAPSGDVAAIVDWEMATLGTPLLDFGRVLSTWPDNDGKAPMNMRVEPWSGFPTRDELIERYVEASGLDVTHLRWFEILSCYKLAIILEGSYARAQAGDADVDTGLRLHRSAVALLQRALEWLECA